MIKSYFTIFFLFVLPLSLSKASHPESGIHKVLFPTKGKVSVSFPIMFPEYIPNAPDSKVNTDVAIIVKDGEVIYEKYARGYNKNMKHLSWSIAKTLAGILIGQAAEDKLLSLNQSIKTYLSYFNGEAKIIDLLQMSSGIKFTEEYSGIPVDADVTKMLYLFGPKTSFSSYVLSLPLRNEVPGKHFYYSSGDTNILMEVLRQTLPPQEYSNYPWKKLFDPMGIDATFEQDNWGRFVGSSYIYMKPHDYLKIGRLLVNQGAYRGKQIIPKWYFELMTQVAPGVNQKAVAGTSKTRAYSMQVTTNLPIPQRRLPPEYPYLPTDSLILIGHQGQLLVASPSQDLIILRLATDQGTGFDRQKFLKEAHDLIEARGFNLDVAIENKSNYVNTESVQTKREKKKLAPLKTYTRIPKLMNRLAVKEYCSCIYVTKRSHGQCKEDLRISIPLNPFYSVDDEFNIVSGSYGPHLLGFIAQAEFVNNKLGCRLFHQKRNQ